MEQCFHRHPVTLEPCVAPPLLQGKCINRGQMVTMATELFMVTPDTIDQQKGNIYVHKERMNKQKGICSGVFVDNT